MVGRPAVAITRLTLELTNQLRMPELAKPPSTKGKKINKLNVYTYAKLVNFMLDGVYSCQELADLTGLHYVTVLDYTRELYRVSATHIVDYQEDANGRQSIKIYMVGRGEDAVRMRMTNVERTARYRAKKKLRDEQAALTLMSQVAPVI